MPRKKKPGPQTNPPRCRFDHLYKSGSRRLPCRKCRKQIITPREPISFESNEFGIAFTWWTAVDKDDGAAIFRVPMMPPGRDAQWRFDEIRHEYENAWEATLERKERHQHGNPTRGRLLAAAEVNASFANLARFVPVKFRPATACEVACWMVTHQSDIFAFDNIDEVFETLEGYVGKP